MQIASQVFGFLNGLVTNSSEGMSLVILAAGMIIGFLSRKIDIYSPGFVGLLLISSVGMLVGHNYSSSFVKIDCGPTTVDKMFNAFAPCFRLAEPLHYYKDPQGGTVLCAAMLMATVGAILRHILAELFKK